LALRLGTSIADSWKEIPFGPYSTDWASHPMLCAAFGVPLSFLSPWVAYWTFAALLTCLQAACLVVAAKWANVAHVWMQATGLERSKLLVLFVLCGVYFPQYVLLHQAQYHGLSMLFVLLALRRGTQVFGFVGSALSKPLLAPAGLLLFAERDFRSIAKIVVITVAGTLPFFWLGRPPTGAVGAESAGGSVFDVLGKGGWLKLKYSVMNWNQEMSLSKVFERVFDGETNFYLRLALALVCLATAFYALLRAKEREIALSLAVLSLMLLYARGHEYHAVTLLPALVFVGSQKGGLNPCLLIGTLLLALPSSWWFLTSMNKTGQADDIASLIQLSTALGWAFVVQKPLGLLFLWLGFLGNLPTIGARGAAENPEQVPHPKESTDHRSTRQA
jgi:hypothetical protein